MHPAFSSWDASSLPSTGSDHVPIVIRISPPSDSLPPPRPRWVDTDWPSLDEPLRLYQVPPVPSNPSPQQLDQWFSSTLDTLTSRIRTATPVSRPSPRSKPWWTPILTALRKENSKAVRTAKSSQADTDRQLGRHSKNGYFRAIKRARATYWSAFLARTTPQDVWTAKKFVAPRKTPRVPALPGADTPASINTALLDHFFPPRPAVYSRGRLTPHTTHDPLTKEEIAQALPKSSPSSGPGPDEIPYSVQIAVNRYNPAILHSLLVPLVAFSYHPPTLKHANGVVLDKPGKTSYDSQASFRIIVFLKTDSKILERVMTARLMTLAASSGLLHPNQCGALPALSTSDAVATLTHEIRTLQHPQLKVTTLFLDIKAGFDNVNAGKLRARLLKYNTPSYLVDWVSSFLTERTCILVFQGSPNTPAPVTVGTPQGSPISPSLFLSYVAPLKVRIPKGLMVSYVDNFSVTVAS